MVGASCLIPGLRKTRAAQSELRVLLAGGTEFASRPEPSPARWLSAGTQTKTQCPPDYSRRTSKRLPASIGKVSAGIGKVSPPRRCATCETGQPEHLGFSRIQKRPSRKTRDFERYCWGSPRS